MAQAEGLVGSAPEVALPTQKYLPVSLSLCMIKDVCFNDPDYRDSAVRVGHQPDMQPMRHPSHV
jgi:hypothetical protein